MTAPSCGRYDEITPACSETIAAGVLDSRLVVFEQSGHLARLDEADLYAETVAAFLATHDRTAQASGGDYLPAGTA